MTKSKPNKELLKDLQNAVQELKDIQKNREEIMKKLQEEQKEDKDK